MSSIVIIESNIYTAIYGAPCVNLRGASGALRKRRSEGEFGRRARKESSKGEFGRGAWENERRELEKRTREREKNTRARSSEFVRAAEKENARRLHLGGGLGGEFRWRVKMVAGREPPSTAWNGAQNDARKLGFWQEEV